MKNIIICCDGTGNEYDRNNTNVVETYKLALKNNDQVAFYDPGVGTGGWEYTDKSLKALGDQSTGHGLQKNVEDSYRILMNCYEAGDKVYLFGFSRGAFTARSLAGMLHKCGLLRPGNENLIEYATKMYNTRGNDDVARGFKRDVARPCPVHFIGVWDTVESLILNAGKKFHDATLNSDVTFGYHAISIDEKRKDFPPCLWDESRETANQIIEQVWFAGVHSDIGGWYEERGLSNITLHWMMGKAKAHGIQIDESLLQKMKKNEHDKLHNSRTGIWKLRRRFNRKIPENALIHQSVINRKEEPANNYRIKLPGKYTVVEG